MLRTGTHHFVTELAAVTYYASQECDRAEVKRKIRSGEIAIGRPPKRADSHVQADSDGRYWYIAKATA